MDVHQLIRSARGGTIGRAYVLVGAERFLAERAVQILRAAILSDGIPGFNDDVFHGKGLAAESVIGCARTVPMMARRRFVLVREAEDVADKELDRLADYLAAPVESACLVLVAEKIDGRSRLAKAAKQADAWVDCEPLRPRDVRSFVEAECKRRGHPVDGDASEAIAEAIGADLAAIDDALERLSLYAGAGARIGVDAVDACVTKVRTESIWALVDAVSSRDSKTALGAAASLLADREPPLRILALVARQVRMVAKMRGALADGMSPPDAAKRAGAPPFKADDLARAAKRFGAPELRAAFRTLADTDLALKGSKRPPELVLEQSVLCLCSGRPFPPAPL